MFLYRLWADWQKYLHFYLTGSVMVTIESQWYSAETHCEQGPEEIVDYATKTLFINNKISKTSNNKAS